MLRQAILSITALFMALGGLTLGTTASAQNAPGPGSNAQLQRDRARCDGVQQDRAACLREAGAAQQEARRAGLTSANANRYENNALARCQLQPAAERADCEARINGNGQTTVEGSVMGGGVIRETVTPIPTPAR